MHSPNSVSLTTMLDPAIIADVQRALKMKARREARLRTAGSMHTDVSPHSFFSNPSSPSRAPISPGEHITFPSVNCTDAGEDFASTSDPTFSHPMPRSLDNGATLNWSSIEVGEEPKHERRWSLAINKHKNKDKAMTISSPDRSSIVIPHDYDYDGLFHHNLQTWLLIPYV